MEMDRLEMVIFKWLDVGHQFSVKIKEKKSDLKNLDFASFQIHSLSLTSLGRSRSEKRLGTAGRSLASPLHVARGPATCASQVPAQCVPGWAKEAGGLPPSAGGWAGGLSRTPRPVGARPGSWCLHPLPPQRPSSKRVEFGNRSEITRPIKCPPI